MNWHTHTKRGYLQDHFCYFLHNSSSGITLYFDFIKFNPFLAFHIWKETITEWLLPRSESVKCSSPLAKSDPSVYTSVMAELGSYNRDRTWLRNRILWSGLFKVVSGGGNVDLQTIKCKEVFHCCEGWMHSQNRGNKESSSVWWGEERLQKKRWYPSLALKDD